MEAKGDGSRRKIGANGRGVPTDPASVKVADVRLVTDDSMEAGQVATWDCVWLGSYPQSEVSVDDPAYASLEDAAWDAHGDATVQGTRYRRICRDDATNDASWPGDAPTWRYFRCEPIKWRVLETDDASALLLSDIALDCQCYNVDDEDVAWETSSIRSWLNGYDEDANQSGLDFRSDGFLHEAFSPGELTSVLATALPKDAGHDGPRNSVSEDKVFLLSGDEVWGESAIAHGFVADPEAEDEARCCKVSSYAHAMGAWVDDRIDDDADACSEWWLRSSGSDAEFAAYVDDAGLVDCDGCDVYGEDVAVRPALRIDVRSPFVFKAGTVSSNGVSDELATREEDALAMGNVCGPLVDDDPSMGPDKAVTWHCIWFGSYPQSEVVESDAVYELLEDTDWDERGDAVVDGTRYRRVSGGDISRSYTPRGVRWKHSWAIDRYFRYEPIKWRVLEVDGTCALVVSDVALDSKPFDAVTPDTSVAWENSTVRSWLNGYGEHSNWVGYDYTVGGFLDTALSASEREAVLATVVNEANKAKRSRSGGSKTEDKAFLLSDAEAYGTSSTKYGFASDGDAHDTARRCEATDYARAMGARVSNDGNCYWWLRSRARNERRAVYVGFDGDVVPYGDEVDESYHAIRPAMRIDLSTAHVTYAGAFSYDGEHVRRMAIRLLRVLSSRANMQQAVCVAEPRIQEQTSKEKGQAVTWDCVWLGSYPQSEVSPTSAVYPDLQEAAWDAQGDAMVGGNRYRRICRDDAVGNESWPEEAPTWRYFRYEPIKWRVLETDGATALVVSDLALDRFAYNDVKEDVTWETSSVRSWLNSYSEHFNQSGHDYRSSGFMGTAFTNAELESVLRTTVVNKDNGNYGTPGGFDTQDGVFLLALEDVWGFREKRHGLNVNDNARCCETTDYARAMGMHIQSEGDCYWWLRSPGAHGGYAIAVRYAGYVNLGGVDVNYDDYAIRPAMRINVISNNVASAGTVFYDGVVRRSVAHVVLRP